MDWGLKVNSTRQITNSRQSKNRKLCSRYCPILRTLLKLWSQIRLGQKKFTQKRCFSFFFLQPSMMFSTWLCLYFSTANVKGCCTEVLTTLEWSRQEPVTAFQQRSIWLKSERTAAKYGLYKVCLAPPCHSNLSNLFSVSPSRKSTVYLCRRHYCFYISR